MSYQPKTGEKCHCKAGVQRDNCPDCEGTGMRIDFRAIRERTQTKTKRIEWSYPTSPNAERFKLGKVGCWTVELIDSEHLPIAIGGFADYDRAKQFANDRPEPWDKLTR